MKSIILFFLTCVLNLVPHLREDHKLSEMFEPKREELPGSWRHVYNWGLHSLDYPK